LLEEAHTAVLRAEALRLRKLLYSARWETDLTDAAIDAALELDPADTPFGDRLRILARTAYRKGRANGAGRVVVPEPTSEEWKQIAENARSADLVDFLSGAAAYGLWLRGKIPDAIPSSRVMWEGEASVDGAYLDALIAVRVILFEHMATDGGIPMTDALAGAMERIEAHEASLRAAQEAP
jgi:hypothetical protein